LADGSEKVSLEITPDVENALSSPCALMSLAEVTADNIRNLFKLMFIDPSCQTVRHPYGFGGYF
jgi:hypothetical protein